MCVWPRFSKKWCYKIKSCGCLRIPWSLILHTCTDWLEVCGHKPSFVLLQPFYFLVLFTKIFRHLFFFFEANVMVILWPWFLKVHSFVSLMQCMCWSSSFCSTRDHDDHIFFIVFLMYFICWSSWFRLVGDDDAHLFFFWWC